MSEAISTTDFPNAFTMPLEDIDVSDPMLFKHNAFWPYFERMRNEDPVHYCKESQFGPYWSITKFDDIMEVEKNHEVFSSEVGGITIFERMSDFKTSSFIQMDPPKHDIQRKTVTGVVAPTNLALLQPVIRERAAKILDELPIGETFNWVDRVSIELTTQMLATLFDFPFEDRRKLTYWSDCATSSEANGGTTPEAVRREALLECLEVFTGLWNERINKAPGNDLISMLAHGKETQNMDPMEYLGNLILLIVGGNDTTRNSMTGGVLHLHQNPSEMAKLKANHGLIPSMVSEIIRYQTPLPHMRRTATRDVELNGTVIPKGGRVVLWYVSGNRDSNAIPEADKFIIDRPNVRNHLSFGMGIHRCMGNRLAEMQLRIVWEEILERFERIEVVGPAVRTCNSFVRGYHELPVRLHPKV